MKKRLFRILLTLSVILLGTSYAAAHCEIPCCIYDDGMRIAMISEHITTLEKSMTQIHTLESGKTVNYNQLVRWIMNKEHHANEIQEIVSQYFMTQRIKPESENYEKKLTLLHQMLIYSMKCKQSTDLSHIAKLRSLLKEFDDLYFGKSGK